MSEQSSKPTDTVSVDFAVGIGDGKFTATAIVPAGQTNLTQILPVIQSLENSLIEGVTAQYAEAGPHRLLQSRLWRMLPPDGHPEHL